MKPLTLAFVIFLVHLNLYAVIYSLCGRPGVLWFAAGMAWTVCLTLTIGLLVGARRRPQLPTDPSRLDALRTILKDQEKPRG